MLLKFRLGSRGTVGSGVAVQMLVDGLVVPFLLPHTGGGVVHKVRVYGVNSASATVYVPRLYLILVSSSRPTQGYSDLQSPEDFSPPQIYPSTSDSPGLFAQLHLHLSRNPPSHSSPHIVHQYALCGHSGDSEASPHFYILSLFHVYFPQRSSPGAHCRAVLINKQ